MHQLIHHASALTLCINSYTMHQLSHHASTLTPCINSYTMHQLLHCASLIHHASTLTPCIHSHTVHQLLHCASTLTLCINSHTMHQLSHCASTLTLCINSHTVHQLSHHVSTLTLCISSHTVHKLSHCASTLTLCINSHTMHQLSHCASTFTPCINSHTMHQLSHCASTLTLCINSHTVHQLSIHTQYFHSQGVGTKLLIQKVLNLPYNIAYSHTEVVSDTAANSDSPISHLISKCDAHCLAPPFSFQQDGVSLEHLEFIHFVLGKADHRIFVFLGLLYQEPIWFCLLVHNGRRQVLLTATKTQVLHLWYLSKQHYSKIEVTLQLHLPRHLVSLEAKGSNWLLF